MGMLKPVPVELQYEMVLDALDGGPLSLAELAGMLGFSRLVMAARLEELLVMGEIAFTLGYESGQEGAKRVRLYEIWSEALKGRDALPRRPRRDDVHELDAACIAHLKLLDAVHAAGVRARLEREHAGE